MILANVAAAETLEKARVPLIYRVHDEPSLEKVECAARIPADARHLLRQGRRAARPRPSTACCARSRAATPRPLVNEVVLRSQAQAEYAAENYGHFGLNLRRYAHFTSPIRRYADLIVHRGLIRALKLGPDGLARRCRSGRARRDRRRDLRHRAPRHAGRARDHRPADRASSRRPHRRHVRRPHLRRHPRRPVREAARDRRRRLHAGAHHRRRIFPLRRGHATP